MLSTLGACNKVDNIGCLTTGVAPKLDYCPRRWLRDLRGGYHFASFASCFAARSCLPTWFIITHVWFELGTYKKIPQTLGSSVGHGRSFCKDLAQSAGGLNDGPVFVNYFPHFWQVWVICQHEGENVWLGFKSARVEVVGLSCEFERSPVAEHFCSPEHDFLNHATLCCLDHNPEWTDRTRKARESYWIRRLNNLRPYGINKGDQ